MKYKYDELNKVMTHFSNFFDVVRLVDPSRCSVMNATDDGVTLDPDNCYQVWNRHSRCENCISLQAYQSRQRMTKFEILRDDIYYIVSSPIDLVLADGSERLCTLELVLKNSNKVLLNHLKGNQYFSDIMNFEEKLYEDALTQIYNRRFFSEKAYCYDCYENPYEMVFICVDLKSFKKVNDNYGHVVGDTILYKTAQLIKKTIGENNYVIRMGGDEFLIILDHCNEEKAKQIIQNIKAQLHTELLYDQQKDQYMYLNFGMAYQEHFDGTDECIHEMYAKADENMYLDKLKEKRKDD
ncbi:MAG: GGDEF domain-containing protein [Longibaculum sp.]